MLVLDAEGAILGRLASYVAKKLLEGEEVRVVNAERAVVSGKREWVIEKYQSFLNVRNRANPRKGPFHVKRPDLFVKKVIRGMLPKKKKRGRDALKRLRVYLGVPEEFKGKAEKLELFSSSKITRTDLITVGEICHFLGWKGESS
ncbi:50S ribosomal protein L13 [Thermococci archaeon]|nr:MAG: 50S ribosomal protein L13 [Thermococci archaeon]RLF97364.1 MAG: 50S ribosomal protein L13 [Thermococci archaeon]